MVLSSWHISSQRLLEPLNPSWFYLLDAALALHIILTSLFSTSCFTLYSESYVFILCSFSICHLKPIYPLASHFLFRLFSLLPLSAGIHCFCVSPLCNISQRCGHLPPYELSANSSLNDHYFSYFVKWFIHQLRSQIRLQIYICLSLLFNQILSPIRCHLYHLMWSLYILQSSLLSHGWLAWQLARDESSFSLSSTRCASLNIWHH